MKCGIFISSKIMTHIAVTISTFYSKSFQIIRKVLLSHGAPHAAHIHEQQSFLPSSHCSNLQVGKQKDRTNPSFLPSFLPEERDVLVRPAHTRNPRTPITAAAAPQTDTKVWWDTNTEEVHDGMGAAGGQEDSWLSGRCRFKRDRVRERFKPTSDASVGGILKNFPGSPPPPPLHPPPTSRITWSEAARCL